MLPFALFIHWIQEMEPLLPAVISQTSASFLSLHAQNQFPAPQHSILEVEMSMLLPLQYSLGCQGLVFGGGF